MKKEYEALYLTKEDEGDALKRLVEILKILRTECPWDRVQTHETLTSCMLEEAYEAVDAINQRDTDNLREELGDVLLQVLFHSNLAENEGKFTLSDVVNEECEKMLRRHPHVFSEEIIKGVDKTIEKWENVKSEEHGELSYTDRLRRVPKALPALMKNYKVQSKASKAGFDWQDVYGPFAKIEEELDELKAAYSNGNSNEISEELGDLLFSVVNVSRFLDMNPEESLNESTAKFIKRFAFIERVAIDQGVDIRSMSSQELDNLWIEAKTK